MATTDAAPGAGTRPALHTWAGEVPYAQALEWQTALVRARQRDEVDDVVLGLTHPPVYTAGRFADVEAGRRDAHPDIPVVRIDRGGELTYHGPGQAVVYPILGLSGATAARGYVTALEAAIIDVLASYDIGSDRREGMPGVWVGQDKVAAIGVRITRRVTKHGVALNVDPDLSHFDGIVPCGITDGGVTSLAALGVRADVEEVGARLVHAIGAALGRTLRRVAPAELGLHAVA